MRWLTRSSFTSRTSPRVRALPPARLRLEALEERWLLYAVTGNLWPHPEHITLSFQPDGTNLGAPTSNLISTLTSRFGSASAWQNQILRAAQVWAQQANINFSVVDDSGADSGSGSYQQGDPDFGDIRIGGYNLGSTSLALSFYPPAGNNYSVAGDIAFNTSKAFNINGNDYDLFTVALHEIGHALGMGHASSSLAVMYGTYNGRDTALNADDISGIKYIYGARPSDRYDATASNGSFAAATNITSQIDTVAKNALVTGLDITTTTDADYYKLTVPAGMTGPLTVKVQSSGLSLLAPTFRVYNSSLQQISTTMTGSGYSGSTIQAQVNVTAGSTYYVMVDGKDTTANGTGAYALGLTFSGGSSCTAEAADTQTANGTPLSGSGGIAVAKGQSSAIGDLLGVVTGLLGGLLGGVGSLLSYDALEAPSPATPHQSGCGCGACSGCTLNIGSSSQQTQPADGLPSSLSSRPGPATSPWLGATALLGSLSLGGPFSEGESSSFGFGPDWVQPQAWESGFSGPASATWIGGPSSRGIIALGVGTTEGESSSSDSGPDSTQPAAWEWASDDLDWLSRF